MDSPTEYETIPKFGTSTCDYETVVGPFYAYWQSYCTKKTYTWLCPHNISEIRDRRILREIEKEMKKIAQKKRKERNDEVRALVSFIRKRDKRVQEYRKVLEAKAEQNRIKQQLHRLAQLKKNQQEAQEMQKNQSNLFNADHEEQLRQLEQAYGDEVLSDENDDGDVSDDYYIDDLYCVACNKAFKNVSSFENHESSKKHRENTERLKEHMRQEDEAYTNDEHDGNNSRIHLESKGSSCGDLSEHDTEEEYVPKKKANKKAKKSKTIKTQYKSDSEIELEDINDSLGDVNAQADRWSDHGGKKKKKQKNKKDAKKTIQNEVEVESELEAEPSLSAKNGAGNNKGKGSKQNKSSDHDQPNNVCVTCGSSFESKNKLFAHLKKTNHGVYIAKK